jgi:polyribonucleotide nucleotidyltransferase
MIDGSLDETKESVVIEMFGAITKEIKELVDFQETIIKELKPVKRELALKEIDKELEKEVEGFIKDKLEGALFQTDKPQRMDDVNKIKDQLGEYLEDKYPEEEDKVYQAFDIFEEKINKSVHQNAIEKGKRIDGRKLDEVREISSEISLLPRAHGSGLFNRGTTQALSVVTLGPPGAEQLLDELENEGKKRFMHHYNFPPFSVGEVRPMRGPGRREIGHGALAEKALLPLIPSREEFPYTIRIVSEILSSNGSSSMASVCGSTLALLDAGVPVKGNAAGIAMGLMTDGEKYKILTDIQGPEDHHGDMDLKVAGTKEGITALQMDVKVDGVSLKILEEALIQAKQAREDILNKMEAVIKSPKADLSTFAPRVYTVKINPDKIGTIIGPGGKMINKITEETGVEIDIDDDGTVFITSSDSSGADKAVDWVKSLTKELKIGEVIQGKIVKITDFGAFIELAPGQDGLLHISEILTGKDKGRELKDIISEGGTITVKIKNIDDKGKISLVLFKEGVLM